ncbi:MAG: hypothetical protein WC613_02350 [Candidatus Aenigmatarchaeota archaeon]
MDWLEMAKRLRGMQTAASAAKALDVGRRTAVNYISELRKLGYVRTSRGKGKIRMYEISETKAIKKSGTDLYDFINSLSPVKVHKPYEYIIHGKLSAEEAIARAIETKDFRTILAAMYLFRLVKDWPELNRQTKMRGLQRSVGALYDLARKYIRVRAMDKRTRNSLLKARTEDKFIVPHMRSKNFQDIERVWNVYLPFNDGDMRR